MGPYTFSQAFLSGFFTFAAISALVLWWAGRRDRTLLILALVCVIGAVQAYGSLSLASAMTLEAARRGLRLRTMLGAANVAALTWLFADIASIRARGYVWFVTAAMMATIAAIVLDLRALGADVIGVERVSLPWGEDYSALTREPATPAAAGVYLVIASTVVFNLMCAWRFRAVDRTSGTLLMVAAAGSALPLVSGVLTDMLHAPLPYLGSVGIVATTLVIAVQFVENRRRNAQLVAAQRRFRAMFDQSFDLIALMKPDGSLVEINGTALGFAGVRSDRIIGQPLRDMPWWSHSPELQRQLDEAVAAARRGQLVRFEATHRAASGTLRLMDVSVTPVRDASGEVSLLIAESRDIQERIVAEQEKRTLEQQLAQAQKMEALGQLAGGIAHDFNNLLTVILNHVDVMQGEAGDDRRRQDLAQVRQAAEQAASMTGQLLTFSRQSISEAQVIDPGAIVADAATMLSRTLGELVDLRLDVARDLHAVRMDPRQLGRVVINLAINARDAMPDGGTLDVRVRNAVLDRAPAGQPTIAPGGYVLLSMADSGTGMTNEAKARLFEPFFTTKELGRGTGLGLAVVDGIVRQAGGHIVVASEPGHGSTFEIYLPGVSAAEPVQPAETSGPRSPTAGSETILLVEDDAAVRGVLQSTLERQGYRVIAAVGGEDAVDKARAFAGRIDLVVTDVIMPGMSGPQLVAHLRSESPDLPVLFVSGYAPDAMLAPLDDDRAAYLQKPFIPSALATRVRSVLDGRAR